MFPLRADDGRKFVCRHRFELEFEVGAPVFRVDSPAADVRERFRDFCRGICAASGILRFARARPARILRRGVFGSLRALVLAGEALCDELGVVLRGVHRQVKGEFPDFRLLSLARMFFLPPCAEKEKEERACRAARGECTKKRRPKPVQVKAEYAEKEQECSRKHENRVRPKRKVKTFHGNPRPAV